MTRDDARETLRSIWPRDRSLAAVVVACAVLAPSAAAMSVRPAATSRRGSPSWRSRRSARCRRPSRRRALERRRQRPRQPAARRQPRPRRRPLRPRRRGRRRRSARRRGEGRRCQPPLPDGHGRGQARRAARSRPAWPRVGGVTEDLAPIVSAAHLPVGAPSSPRGTASFVPPKPASDFGVDGSGVTVGILSDSFDQATSADERPPTRPKTSQAATCPAPGNPVRSDHAGRTSLDDSSRRRRPADGRGAGDGPDRPRPRARRLARLRDRLSTAKLSFADNIEAGRWPKAAPAPR